MTDTPPKYGDWRDTIADLLNEWESAEAAVNRAATAAERSVLESRRTAVMARIVKVRRDVTERFLDALRIATEECPSAFIGSMEAALYHCKDPLRDDVRALRAENKKLRQKVESQEKVLTAMVTAIEEIRGQLNCATPPARGTQEAQWRQR